MNAAFKKVRGAIGDADPALRDLIVQSIVELAEDSLGAGRYEKRIKRDGMIRGGGIITPIDHLPGSARPSRRPRHRHRRASSACRRGCSVAAMNEPPPGRRADVAANPPRKNRARCMDKRQLSERDICTKFITPALRRAGWDEMLQIREEVSFTKGRIIVRGKLVTRGQAKRGMTSF
jgi:hypothetical protein